MSSAHNLVIVTTVYWREFLVAAILYSYSSSKLMNNYSKVCWPVGNQIVEGGAKKAQYKEKENWVLNIWPETMDRDDSWCI